MRRIDPALKRERKLEAERRYMKANPQKAIASRLRWAAEHPEEMRAVWRAHATVRRAVRRGELVRPALCRDCGQPGRRIEAAHHDYSKPLEVRWLCSSCHRRYDNKAPKAMGAVA